MGREGLPTRLISAAPLGILDPSTSLWRLLSFDVRVRGRCWEGPSRMLRIQQHCCCVLSWCCHSAPLILTRACLLLLFATESTTRSASTTQSLILKFTHYRGTGNCSTPRGQAHDISDHNPALIGHIAAWENCGRRRELAKPTIRPAASAIHPPRSYRVHNKTMRMSEGLQNSARNVAR